MLIFAAHAPVFVEVQLNAPIKSSRLKAGDTLRGKVIDDVFSGYARLIPGGSQVSMRVDGMERRRKEQNYKLPWPISHFRSKYEEFPKINYLTVSLRGGDTAIYRVSQVAAYDQIHVEAQTGSSGKSSGELTSPAQAKKATGSKKSKSGSMLQLVIEASPSETGGAPASVKGNSADQSQKPPEIKILAAGTETKLALLSRLSASKSRSGEAFQAMLAEPLRLSSGEIVPEGSIFKGQVRKRAAPRWLSRPGSLYLTFNQMVLPTGTSVPLATSVVGIEAQRNMPMKVGPEGGLRGGSPGKAQMLLNLGVGFGISKVADDSFQLIAEALISTATDASTAGTARLLGMALGGFFLIKRHGRDVVLPPYTMIYVRFDRLPSQLPPEVRQTGMR